MSPIRSHEYNTDVSPLLNYISLFFFFFSGATYSNCQLTVNPVWLFLLPNQKSELSVPLQLRDKSQTQTAASAVPFFPMRRREIFSIQKLKADHEMPSQAHLTFLSGSARRRKSLFWALRFCPFLSALAYSPGRAWCYGGFYSYLLFPKSDVDRIFSLPFSSFPVIFSQLFTITFPIVSHYSSSKNKIILTFNLGVFIHMYVLKWKCDMTNMQSYWW